jgi:cysteine desulfurase
VLYFDHNATTPVRPEALERLAAVEREVFGNPSSLHGWGRRARALLEESREELAAALGGEALEYVFTSGGTEANRLAIEGVLAHAFAAGGLRPHAVASGIEHPSVLEVYRRLESEGRVELSVVRAREDGRVDPAVLLSAVRPQTVIVSLQHSNNETGVLQDVVPVARACRERGIACHVDAVQSLGKTPLDVGALGADLVALSSHKLGGPRGAGALWIRRGGPHRPPWSGGPQEQRRRPGTENLPAIAGFTCAAGLAAASVRSRSGGEPLGELLWRLVAEQVPGAVLNGDPAWLLPNTRNISFEGVAAQDLLMRLDLQGVGASSGSACASGSREPSHVLEAMGLERRRVLSAVRFSCGWTTEPRDVEELTAILQRVVPELRRL